ncbi:Cu/Ag efflux protein CusF [Metabacillus crassostreae]|uniref:NAD-binding protein n=1 Tax=Metabacillus crassostreae TaxID=929098 RepID=UPI00195D31C9|nr:NAD-binding protein [Metabacillus crassostreae]MBM7606354.1 Cu/Ag efflux protein CusF [Metabacillus crassostreae]
MSKTRFFAIYKTHWKYILLYFSLLSLLGVFTFSVPFFDKSYAIIPAIIILGCIVFLPKLQQYSLQIFTLLLALSSGIYGFSIESIKDYNLTNVIYSTVRLFALDVDPVFSKNGDRFISYPPSIEVARYSAVAYIISAISQLILSYFRQSLRLWYMTNRGNHYVILGLNQESYTFASNLLKNKNQVIIIKDTSFPLEDNLTQQGAVLLDGDLLSTTTLRKAAIHKAKCLVTLHHEDAYNLNIVKAVHHYFVQEKAKLKERQITFYVQQNHTRTERLFTILEKKLNTESSQISIQLHPISIHELIARQLFNQHPIYKHHEEKALQQDSSPYHLLIIGFGLTGQQIALQAIQRGHFFNKQPLAITIVDTHAKAISQTWKEAYPRLQEMASFQFIEQDVEAEDIGKLIEEQNLPITSIYISLDSDEKDILQGMRVHQRFKKIPIYIKLQRDQFFAKWLHEEEAFHHIYQFGALEDVLTEEIVIQEQLDKMANLIHDMYADKTAQSKSWEKLSHFEKQSNRALMNHYEAKLFLLGYEAAEETPEKESISERIFTNEVRKKLEQLAIVEHRRWNAFHYSNGWDAYPLKHVTKTNHKDAENKLHACLVEWDDLDKISEIRDIDFKQYDRDTILQLYDLTEKMGKALYRRGVAKNIE